MENQDFENIKDFLGEKNSILCLLNKYYPMIAKEIIKDLGIRFEESIMCAVIYSDLQDKTSNSSSKSVSTGSGSDSKGGSINLNALKKYLEENIVSKYKEIKKTSISEKDKNEKIKKLINGSNIKKSVSSKSDSVNNKKTKDYLNSRNNNKRPPGAGGMVALTLNKDNKKSNNKTSDMNNFFSIEKEKIALSDENNKDIEKILKELKNKKTIKEAVELISSKKDIIKILYLILLEINNDNNSNKNASKEEMIKYIMDDIKQEGTFTSQFFSISNEDVLIENFVNKVNEHLSNSNKISKKDIEYMRREERRRLEQQQQNKRKVALNSSYELKNKSRYEYYLESIRNKK